MKIQHKVSGNIIDVPSDHALMLFGQGWKEYKEEKKDGLQEQGQETSQKVRGTRKGVK